MEKKRNGTEPHVAGIEFCSVVEYLRNGVVNSVEFNEGRVIGIHDDGHSLPMGQSIHSWMKRSSLTDIGI